MICLAPAAQAQITAITRYPLDPGMQAMAIVAGPDGKMWFTERAVSPTRNPNRVVRMALDGTVLERFILDTGGSLYGTPSRLTTGPDGRLWADNWDSQVTRISPDGVLDNFALPTSLGAYSDGITTGSDGNIWVLLRNGLARVDPDGHAVAYPVQSTHGLSGALLNGPDGLLWFYVVTTGLLQRLDPITGNVQSLDLRSQGYNLVQTLTEGVDGQVWFLESFEARISKIDPTSGKITTYPGITPYATSITAGPDGNMWYVSSSSNPSGSAIGRVTPQGDITEYPLPANTGGQHIIAGQDGKLWYIEAQRDPGGNRYSIATFGIPVTVTASATDAGGHITPARQTSHIGQSVTLALQPDPSYLFDTLRADRCGPIAPGSDGTATTAPLTSDCAVSVRFTPPQCSADPTRGFAGTPVSLLCSGLPALRVLEIPGASCSDIDDTQALCLGTIGQTDGSGLARDAHGHAVALAAAVTGLMPPACEARPSSGGFANTPVELQCTGLPPRSSLTVAGALCSSPEPDGTLLSSART